MPKVSVIIPTKDRPEMVREAVSSVLTQTTSEFEVLVVDDGSDPPIKNLSDNRRGLAHLAESSEQNVPVPLLFPRLIAGALGVNSEHD